MVRLSHSALRTLRDMLSAAVGGGLVAINLKFIIQYNETMDYPIFGTIIITNLIFIVIVVFISYVINKQIEMSKAALVKLRFKNKDIEIEFEGPDNWVNEFWENKIESILKNPENTEKPPKNIERMEQKGK